jgi:3-phosphoshikimate 1-carboxyvinyltransferase
MRRTVKAPESLRGELTIQENKSISHRAVILNSIANGKAIIQNFSYSADCMATVNCMRLLGAKIENSGRELRISGTVDRRLCEPVTVLDAGNSATCMRLLAGLLSAQSFFSIITGDESLCSRPMDRIITPLKQMGACIWGRDNDSKPPLAIKGGALSGISYEMPVASAQVKSAILLAGLYAAGKTTVVEPVPSRDHTERMMSAMGIEISRSGPVIKVAAGEPRAIDSNIPGDISSASFWLVAGALHPNASIRLCSTGVNETRTGILDVMRLMGADISIENKKTVGNEPVADIVVESSTLKGTDVGGTSIPRIIDEIPLIALAACYAEGRTFIRDAGELRFKESDRIARTADELKKLGAEVTETQDGMIIEGPIKLRGSLCDSHQDHRLAMMLGIAGLVCEGSVTIDNAEAADISYSGFWQDMETLARD